MRTFCCWSRCARCGVMEPAASMPRVPDVARNRILQLAADAIERATQRRIEIVERAGQEMPSIYALAVASCGASSSTTGQRLARQSSPIIRPAVAK